MVIIANKWEQLLVQRQFLLAPVPIKNSILSIAKSPNLQKTLDFPAGSQHSRRGDEWFNFLHLGWRWLSRRKSIGRPTVSAEVRMLIKQMAQANPLWSAPRIHGELQHLGLEVSERTVSRLMPRRREAPSQIWRTFLDNHPGAIIAIDFFTVPTASFRVLFVMVELAHCTGHQHELQQWGISNERESPIDCWVKTLRAFN